MQPNGTLATAFATLPATLASPDATSTTWTYGVDLPQGGDYNVTAYATDTRRPAGHLPLPRPATGSTPGTLHQS